MSTSRKTLVFGPAYLDRVVHVDRPLIDPEVGVIVDGSALGAWESGDPGHAIRITGLPYGDLLLRVPTDWPGPTGSLILDDRRRIRGMNPHLQPVREVHCLSWHDDLGGMGAGFAKALCGTLCLLIGDDSDPINRQVMGRLSSEMIDVRPIRKTGRLGEWTLMLTSGRYGDKLPIGFRDPGTDDDPFVAFHDEPCDLLVAASMTNRRAASALAGRNASVRMFAPSIRNMLDTSPSVSSFTRYIDILCCNRSEWEALADREEVAWRVSILIVTDGPNGAEIRFTRPDGDPGRVVIPAYPRRSPPRDTNRAGEAFASRFVTTLLDFGWTSGPADPEQVRVSAFRASVASALVLDRFDFGFPSAAEIDEALEEGIV